MQEIIRNNDFIIYGEEDLIPFLEELMNRLRNKKQELMHFFKIDTFPSIPIYLFSNREEYYDFLDNLETEEDKIILTYSGIAKNGLVSFLQNSIMHNYSKLLYASVCKNPHFWVADGLAQCLSGERQKLEINDFYFRMFYLDKIVRRDKKIPYQVFFSNKERFVFNKDYEYDRYDISYLLVHYLKEKYQDVASILINEEKVGHLEETILEECISYYNEKYSVKSYFYEIKNERELMDYMNKYILYGWVDYEYKEHIDNLKNFKELYRTNTIDQIITTKLGTCIEQAKLIKYWLDLMKIENKLFCIRGYETEKDDVQMHCFVLFHYQDFWYHFEHSTIRKRGIYKFNTFEEAIEKTSKRFLKGFDLKEVTEIPTIPDRLTFEEFNQYVNTFPKYEVDKERKL